MTKKCIGCGVTLQTTDKNKLGYVRENMYEKVEYCEACFKLLHYGVTRVVDKKVDESIIDNLNKEKVLYFLDISMISEKTIDILYKIKSEVYLVLNKRDLLPESVKEIKIINYIKKYYDKAKKIFIINSKNIEDVRVVYDYLIKEKIKIIYALGYTSSGKSTFINSLLKIVGKNAHILTSETPNTTIELMKIEINNKLTLIDTPGFTNHNSISNYIDLDIYKKCVSKKEIKPKIYNLQNGFMLLINDIIRIENNSDTLGLVFYLSNSLKYEKMKINRRDTLLNNEKVRINVNSNKDIVIEGLGFIKVLGSGVLDIYVPNKSIITLRDKMI